MVLIVTVGLNDTVGLGKYRTVCYTACGLPRTSFSHRTSYTTISYCDYY